MEQQECTSQTLPKEWRYISSHLKDLILGSRGVTTKSSLRNTCEHDAFISQIEPRSFADAKNDEFWLCQCKRSWINLREIMEYGCYETSEFIACYETSNHGIWLQNIVTWLYIVDGIDRPLNLFFDNKLAVLYSNNNRILTKSKYIDIKFPIVKERVQSGYFRLFLGIFYRNKYL